MAAAYRKALGLASQSMPEDAKQLKEDQRAWLSDRIRRCAGRQCLADGYKERTDALVFYTANVNSNTADATALTGTYLMGQNGTLEVVQLAKGSIKFSLNVALVVNLKTGDVRSGDAAGVVPLKGVVAAYTDPDDNECKITMTFGRTKAVVSQAGTCGFGLNVSADGTYMKVGNAVSKRLD
jgi:hypothetical protein